MVITATTINPKTQKPYTLGELAKIHAEALDAQIAGFMDAITGLANDWKPMVHSMVGDLSKAQQRSNLRQIQFLSGELRKQLNDLGYDKLAQEIVTGYDDSVAYALNAADFAVVGPQPMLSPLMPGIVEAAKTLDLQAYEAIGNEAIRTLSKQLTLDVTVGVSRSRMLAAVDKVMDKTFISNANLYVDTSVRQLDRTVTMGTWKEAGIDEFKYFGPKDKKNRDFCSEHIGKTYTLAEIEKMDNGQGLPVLVYMGGWRCRHTWSPVAKP